MRSALKRSNGRRKSTRLPIISEGSAYIDIVSLPNRISIVRQNVVCHSCKIHEENESAVNKSIEKCPNNSLTAHSEGSFYIDVIPKPLQYVESNYTDVSKTEDNEIKIVVPMHQEHHHILKT